MEVLVEGSWPKKGERMTPKCVEHENGMMMCDPGVQLYDI